MLNKWEGMGRLTKDPELRRTPSGTAVATFSIAVDRDFKGKDGERETDFIDVVAWRQTAEFVSKHFTKGRMAVVEGRLQIGITPIRTAKSGELRRSLRTTSTSETASAITMGRGPHTTIRRPMLTDVEQEMTGAKSTKETENVHFDRR